MFIEKDTTVNISLTNENNQNIGWLMYDESDLNKYIAYPTIRQDNIIGGKVKLKAGVYYFQVHNFDIKEAKYSISVQPEI